MRLKQKRLLASLLIIFTFITFAHSGPASAFPWNGQDVSGPYDWPPYYGASGIPGTSIQGYSFAIVDDFTHGGEDVSRLYPVPTPSNIDNATFSCEGFADPTCVDKNSPDPNWQFIRILPPCKNGDSAESCIEGLQATDASGVSRKLILDHIISNPLQWDGSVGRSLGIGSAPSLWRDPADSNPSDGYIVSVNGSGACGANANCTEIQNFSASVSPYKTVMGNFGGNAVYTTSQGHKGFSGSAPPVCLWHEQGKCGLASNFTEVTQLELVLHLPKIISGWYMGRFIDPNISIEAFDSNYYRLKILAKPASIPLVSAKVDVANASDSQKQAFSNFFCSGGYCGGGMQSNNVALAKYFDLFSNQLNNTAQLVKPTWSVRSVNSGFPCSQFGKVDGVVSTDATLYDGTPPALENGSMNYHVAALHYLPDGSEFHGSYDLLMSSTFARCLYKFTNAPVSAKVEVVNSQGNTSISTSTLTENAGWLHLSVNGFTFSNPTIQVKLLQDAPAPIASPSPNSTSPAANSPTPSTKTASKVTIVCMKGKLTKKVSAIKPTCPMGYKKK